MPHQLLARGLCWFAIWGSNRRLKGFLCMENIDSRCLRVEVESFFVSVHLPKFFGSENLDDAASAINEYTNQRDLDVFSYRKQFVSDTLHLLTTS
ncbi:hypothetical protein IMY05_009G0004700 [Salix suchowensis]|nr:hypothetical protein IMY05_009G0004700 [Salix suchowensis]